MTWTTAHDEERKAKTGCFSLLEPAAEAYAARSLSNSAGSSVFPSLSVMTTCHPSLDQTRALAIAISTLLRSHLTVSFSLVATI